MPYYIIGEDGDSRQLTGNPDASIGGAERLLHAQGRRGYVVLVDKINGREEFIFSLHSSINEPNSSFKEVTDRFTKRNQRRGATNSLFKAR